MNDLIDEALVKNLISKKEKDLIEEYNTRLLSNNVPIIYNLRHLRKILRISKEEQDVFFGLNKNTLYRTFFIPKKNGDLREIEAPSDRLLEMQNWIKTNILEKINVSEQAKGFKRNNSIVDNAKEHIGQKVIINIDLKDFFPSVKYNQIIKIFSYLGYNTQVSHLLTKLCANSKNVLPQGSPASPLISNIVCLKLDKRLYKLAEKWNANYTRYADDITISGNDDITKIYPFIKKIIEDESFLINEKKVRFQFDYQRQEVTGIIVNNKLSVHPRIISEIKNAIYYCSKYGVVSHMKKIGCEKAYYKEHLYGVAYFIKMIDNEKGKYYLNQLDLINWEY